jgi:hypothetical protein
VQPSGQVRQERRGHGVRAAMGGSAGRTMLAAPLGVDTPAPKAGVAGPVQHAAEAGAEVDAVQLLLSFRGRSTVAPRGPPRVYSDGASSTGRPAAFQAVKPPSRWATLA